MQSLAQSPPLVGRENELGLLAKHLDEALNGNGSLILIAGEAGIGKSRLAEEFGELARRKGGHVLVGRCIPGAPSPYLPFHEALTQVTWLRDRELGLKGWLTGPRSRDDKGREPALNPESDSGRTLFAALEFFRKISDKRALVVVLEDLHWADSATVRLLHFLARNSRSLKVLFLGSYRPEDLSTGDGKANPMLDSLRTMRREEVVHEIELDPLSSSELRIVVEGLFGGLVGQDVLDRIASESGGNPLFAVEVVRLLVQTGAVTLQNDVWKPFGKLKVDVPSTVREVVLRRVEKLGREQRRLLESAAVVGREFDAEVLSEVIGVNKLEILELLDSIANEVHLIKAVDEAYMFSHEKIRQTIYEGISPPRRRELHRLIGETLEKRPPNAGQYGELSRHFYYSGENSMCAKYSLLAGQESLNRYAVREALSYFQKGVEATKNDTVLLEQRIKALEGVADSQVELRQYVSALAAYREVLQLLKSPSDIARALRKTAYCEFLNYDLRRAVELLDKAEKQEDVEKVELGRIKGLQGYIDFFLGETNKAFQGQLEAENMFRETGALQELAETLAAESEVFLSTGRVAEALQKTSEAVEIYSRLQSPVGELTMAAHLGDVYFHLGKAEDAIGSYAKSREIASKMGLPLTRAPLFQAFVHYSIDDSDSARREAGQALEGAKLTESNFFKGAVNIILALCLVRLNRLEEAEKALRDGMENIQSVPTAERTPLRCYLSLAQAELFSAKKEWALCDEKFKEAVGVLRPVVFGVLFEAMARTRYAESLVSQGRKADALAEFARAILMYEKLGNTAQIERVRTLASSVKAV